MENNIYIPGDLVMYNGKVRIIKEPRDKNHFDLREPETTLRVCYVPIKEMGGVKLTSEILEKNGWKKETYYGGDYTLGDLHFDSAMFLHIGDYDEPLIDFPIKYVHQLQHLLFGLGIDSEMEV